MTNFKAYLTYLHNAEAIYVKTPFFLNFNVLALVYWSSHYDKKEGKDIQNGSQ